MKNKKIISVLLCGTIMLSGCGSEDKSNVEITSSPETKNVNEESVSASELLQEADDELASVAEEIRAEIEESSSETETEETVFVSEPVILTSEYLECTYDATYEGLSINKCTFKGDDPIIIPAKIDGEAVKAIGENAFSKCKAQSIELPDSIVYIGKEAFAYSNLINIPANVKYIGRYAFESCNKFKDVILPDSLTEMNTSAFYKCSELESVILGDGLAEITPSVFGYCPNLKNVTIGKNVKSIRNHAFSSSGLESVTVLGGVEYESYTYENCVLLTDVTFEDGCTTVVENMFDGCTALKNVVLPDSIQLIDNYSFKNCTELRELVVPDNAEIKNWAFAGCNALTVTYKGEKYIYANDPNRWWN